MKRAIAVSILALVLAVSLAVLAGCGGKKEDTGSQADVEKLVDNAMREASKGNYQPMLELIPPEMRDAYAQMLQQNPEAMQQNVVEAHYRTEQTDADHITVYYWGTVEYTVNGQTQTQTTTEAEAIPIQLVRRDGNWYIDISGQAQTQTQTQTGTGTGTGTSGQ